MLYAELKCSPHDVKSTNSAFTHTNKMLAYILNSHNLEWDSTVYTFRNSGIATKKMVFELFHQIEDQTLLAWLMVVVIDDEASGVALAIGNGNTPYEDFLQKLNKWAQHNFVCEPQTFTRNRLY